MTWHETHLRWQAIRDVVAAADGEPTGVLPWQEEYADLFGDREGLVAALRYRWRITVQAQLEDVPADRVAQRIGELEARHAGLLRVLERHDRERRQGLTPVP